MKQADRVGHRPRQPRPSLIPHRSKPPLPLKQKGIMAAAPAAAALTALSHPCLRACYCGRGRSREQQMQQSLSCPGLTQQTLSWATSRRNQQRRRGTRVIAIAEVMETARWAVRVDHSAQAAPAEASAKLPPSSSSCQQHSSTFQCATSEQELLMGIETEVQSGTLAPRAGEGMKELYLNYRDAVLQSGLENAMDLVVRIMATVLDRILLQFEDPFTFPPYHQSMREPFDYYKFGQEYIRPLLQFSNSYLGNEAHFDEIEDRLKQGHNIVIFSNHQTEADPAVIALLLEASHPYLSERLTYIAGDRVILDPFCKPFSMGRNLICVHSKKHINDEPELVEMKRRANTRALKELALLLRKGKQLIWIAPSGGRDRPDPITNEWSPAAFDPSAVENMRRLVERVSVPGHMYPMALLSYYIMPPPPQVQKEIGEKRLVGCHGVGLSVGPELKLQDEGDAPSALESVREQYAVLDSAVHGGKALTASTPVCLLSQPWLR